MAREKNGWIKLHSSLLEKDFSPVKFKVWVGLLLLANTLRHKNPGLVDLSLRDLASRLGVSVGALVEARDEFLSEGNIKTVLIPTKTKPIMGIEIINYRKYQEKEKVSPSEHSQEKVSPNEQLTKKIVHSMTQKVSPNEQSVSPSEHSRIQNRPPKNTKKPKNTSSRALRKQTTDSEVQKIFEQMRSYLGYPDKTDKDPIPSYGQEGWAIKRMFTRRFTAVEILACWRSKVDQRSEFVSMTIVNQDIGKVGKVQRGGNGKNGISEQHPEGIPGNRPAGAFSDLT